MKKNKVLIFFVIFLIYSFFTYSVKAQQKSERWVCLKTEQVGVHEARLSVSDDPKERLLPNKDTYIFECFTGNICTTGNSNLDLQVFKKDNNTVLKNQYDYKFEGSSLISNPIKSDSQGKIPSFTWKSYTKIKLDRRWMALNYVDVSNDVGKGEERTQQLGTISFEEAFSKSTCVSLSWDPYGRVFDSLTLEPVSGASVSLLVKRADGSFSLMTPADLLGGNIINPQITQEDGIFSFVVPDGVYKLLVNKSGYVFPVTSTSDLHGNYSKIYSDIYPSQTGEVIIQRGKIEHKDVPIKPTSTSQSNQIKLMEYFIDLDKANSITIVQGRVSHPLAQIKAYSLKVDQSNQPSRYRLLTENPVKADSNGKFVVKINQSNFEQGEYFGDLVFEKTNLTTYSWFRNLFISLLSKFVKNVDAQTVLASSFRFAPILNYLEGYAYDSNGQIIPKAKVSLVLNFSNNPSYTTTADEKGYFKINSAYIPSMPYRIIYTTPTGKSIETSTTKFLAQNIQNIKEQKLNLNSFNKTTSVNINNPSTSSSPEASNMIKTRAQTSLLNQQNLPNMQNTNQNTNTNNPNIMLLKIVVLIFILLTVALVIAYFIFKNKNSY
ncbi:MAG: carboxypeptidase-like regulatory domain-containing protein [Microgenomates group bacterium]